MKPLVRLQIKWLAFAIVVMAIVMVAWALFPGLAEVMEVDPLVIGLLFGLGATGMERAYHLGQTTRRSD